MTKPAKTIQTPADVAEHFGADATPTMDLAEINRHLSHRLFKDTDCGAWGQVTPTTTGTPVMTRWAVTLTLTPAGIQLSQLHRAGSARRIALARAPQEARDFLQVEPAAGGGFIVGGIADPAAFMATLSRDGDAMLKVTGRRGRPRVVTFQVKVLTRRRATWQFLCGSIVEGTEAETQCFPVTLPCTPQDLDAAVTNVEEQASEIWNGTHGCEHCFNGGSEGEVDPDCTHCHGRGIVI